MKAVSIATTRIPAYLLQLALQCQRVPPGALTFHCRSVRETAGADAQRPQPSPHAILIQQGGLRALQEMGVNLTRLASKGMSIKRALLLDYRKQPLLEFETSLVCADLSPLWIAPDALREELASHVRAVAHHPDPFEASPLDLESPQPPASPWKGVACPGILLRLLNGRLHRPESQILWDREHAHVGIAQFRETVVVLYAIAKFSQAKSAEQRVCLDALQDATVQLSEYLSRTEPILEDQWFPLDFVGYRPCWDGTILRWGFPTLRLHPLTGQWISYWAIQALRLARELAETNGLSPRFLRELNTRNRQVFQRHMETLNFYLRPNRFWDIIFRPYAHVLSRSVSLRRRVVNRISLMSLCRREPPADIAFRNQLSGPVGR